MFDHLFDHCMDCGAKMIPVKVNYKPRWPYSSVTGRRTYKIKLRCPNRRWYNPFKHWDSSTTVDSKAEAENIEVEIRDRARSKK